MLKPIPRTMVHQLHDVAERLVDRPALWTKRGAAWLPTSWREYAQRVRHFSLGLISLGLQRKQTICILGFNREEWLVADLATIAAGAVPVGIYTTSSPEQIAYIAGHCEAPIVLVENEAYLTKLLAVRGGLPALKHVLVMDPPAKLPEGVMTYAQVLERGAAADDAEYFARLDAAQPGDLATLIYTSGTTGHPKGVMLTHRNICWTTAYLSECASLDGENEVLLSYLPLSHVAEQVASIYEPILHGIQVYFAQSLEKVPENLREVHPTIFFGVPRVWEKFKAKAEAGIAGQSAVRRRLISWARGVSLRFNDAELHGRQMSIVLEAEQRLARRLVFDKLKAKIGFDRTHVFATSAAPIGREVLDFFASIDIVVRELYGQSEVTGPTSANSEHATRLGTLGRPMPGVEVKIAEDGEILVRGENVCAGYFKEPAATAELLETGPDGTWLHSGDVGELDGEGYLRVTGRKKEIIVTSGGKKTPPATLEAMLKNIAPIGNAMVIGEGRNYLVALLALDPEKLADFAKGHGLPADAEALVASPGFREHLQARVDEVNAKVARFENIRKYAVLPHDFTIEGGELTSTLKVRRKVVAEKYAALIEGLYASDRSQSAA